jgi:hypothetical protein
MVSDQPRSGEHGGEFRQSVRLVLLLVEFGSVIAANRAFHRLYGGRDRSGVGSNSKSPVERVESASVAPPKVDLDRKTFWQFSVKLDGRAAKIEVRGGK